MQTSLRQLVKKAPLYYPTRNWIVKRRLQDEFTQWEKNGKPMPPPHLQKQRVLRDFAQQYGLKVLVETGTFYGDMVEAMKSHFDQIYSIELSQNLCEKAQNRFKGQQHIEVIQGDSGIELKNLMARINRPTLFWLDGHYSGGETALGKNQTPVYEELEHILLAPDLRHVIIVDDARCFGADPAYPTIGQLETFVKSKRPNVELSVENDSVRITPR
jgi:hypothetical protein